MLPLGIVPVIASIIQKNKMKTNDSTKAKPTKPVHLRYSCQGVMNEKEYLHPQKRMELLGITYQHVTPQSMGDQWWFWNCENVPEHLPEYITPLDNDPMICIGYGLSQEDVEKIRDYKK